MFFQDFTIPRQPFRRKSRDGGANLEFVGSEGTENLSALLAGCSKGDRHSQRMLYQHFYGYAMSVSLRYSRNKEEAAEILDDGFMKVFSKISKYSPARPFKGWVRRIMINTALDHYRKELRHAHLHSIDETDTQVAVPDSVLHEMAYEDLMQVIQQLTPAYRAVFNLYAIDGYSHEEIAALLRISVGTSKSNLSKARANLREMLRKNYQDEYERYSR